MGKSPASQPAGSAAPRKISVLSTSVGLRSVPQAGAAAYELPSTPARPQPAAERALFAKLGPAPTPSTPALDHFLPSLYRRTIQVSGISEGQTEAQLPAASAMFRIEGEYWHILYAGKHIFIKSVKGLFYLRHLLQHAGDNIHVSSLTALGDHFETMARRPRKSADHGLDVSPRAPLVINDAGTVIDSRATCEYRRRLDELRSELEEASQWADLERAASLQREIELICKELASAYGLNGHPRRLDNQIERMRKAVTNRVHDGIVRIAKQNPVLGRHLSNAVRTGLFCSYSPENDLRWES